MAEAADPRRRPRTSTLDDDVFGAPFNGPLVHEVVRRRAGRAPPGHARRPRPAARSAAAAPSRGARRAPAAPAPARSARRSGPAAASSSARSRATTPSRSTARRAAPRCAARCRCTPSAARSSCSTPPAFDAPSTKQAADLIAEPPRAARRCSWCSAEDEATAAKSFRNLARRERAAPPRTSASPTSSAPPRSCSAPSALDSADRARDEDRREGRGGGSLMDAGQVIIRPIVSEKSLRAGDGRQVHVPRPPGRAQDADQAGRSRSCSTSRSSRSAPRRCTSKPKRRGYTSGRTREWKKAIVQVREGETIPIFQGLEAEL